MKEKLTDLFYCETAYVVYIS